MDCRVNKPYPEVKVEKPNSEYAKILSRSYTGKVSEDTAIHLYLYQHLISKEKDPEFSTTMECISQVEMHHLEILGQLIHLLGMNPSYKSYETPTTSYFWNSSFVSYETNLKRILEIDIEAEETAIKEYNRIKTIIKDSYIIAILERIIEDEELHLKIFGELYEQYKKQFN